MPSFRIIFTAVLPAAIFGIILYSLFGAAPDANELLASPVAIQDGERHIVVTAEPVAMERHSGNKCANGMFQVHLDINSTKISSAPVSITAVWLHQNGAWWRGKIDPPGMREEGAHQSAVATGCAHRSIRPSRASDIIVKLETERDTYYARALHTLSPQAKYKRLSP
ncbi:MAG: hypothetical protein K0S28_2049 [Paucimonas sp.]|jgi:hypothetical protein|nr:hypothetical protein [Paucimonas sp.]